jgi:hypothetical protein
MRTMDAEQGCMTTWVAGCAGQVSSLQQGRGQRQGRAPALRLPQGPVRHQDHPLELPEGPLRPPCPASSCIHARPASLLHPRSCPQVALRASRHTAMHRDASRPCPLHRDASRLTDTLLTSPLSRRIPPVSFASRPIPPRPRHTNCGRVDGMGPGGRVDGMGPGGVVDRGLGLAASGTRPGDARQARAERDAIPGER